MARLFRNPHRTTARAALASLVVVALGPTLAGAVTGGSTWSQFQGGPGHLGSTGEGPAPPYLLAWSSEAPGGGLSGAVIAGEVAISVGEHSVYGFDLASGEKRWTLNRNGGPPAMPAVGEVGGRRVLVFTDQSESSGTALVGVDLGSRRELWRTPLDAVSRSGVTVDGGAAFVGDAKGNLYGIDLATGSVEWTATAAGSIDAPPAAAEGRVFAVARDTSNGRVQVLAVDQSGGDKAWEYAPRVPGTGASAAAVSEGRVFFGSSDRIVRALGVEDGSEAWGSLANAFFSPVTSPAVVGGDVYIVDASGGLYRIDAATGGRVWDFQMNDLAVRSSPVVSGSTVLVGLNDGRLAAVDVGSGNLVWQSAKSSGFIGPIAVGSDTLVALKGGKHVRLVAFRHDPEGVLVDVPSPTKLDLGRLLANYAIALALVIAVLHLPFRAIAGRMGPATYPAAEEDQSSGEEDLGDDPAEDEEP